MKFTKDKMTSIRINGELKEILSEKGITPQNIIDDWLEENISIDSNIKTGEIIIKIK